MSDSEDANTLHPPHGGKTLPLPEPKQPQPSQPYKSWRKKYRKMKHRFDIVFDENKRLFRQDHLLSALAARLREELDGLLELSLDINSTPSLPPDLRFNVHPNPPRRPPAIPVDPAITPEAANQLASEYLAAVADHSIPILDLHVVRAEMENALAAQGTKRLEDLEKRVEPRPVLVGGSLEGEDEGGEEVGYMTIEQEGEYLGRLDRKLGLGDPTMMSGFQLGGGGGGGEEDEGMGGHFADLTAREQERMLELQNPSSQHNWLRTHTRVLAAATAGGIGGGGEDADGGSVISGGGEATGGKKGGGGVSSRRKGTAGKNVLLVKRVGDRAVERAREEGGWSPGWGGGGGGGGGGGEDDEISSVGAAGDETYHPGSKKKAAGERGKGGGGRASMGAGGSVKGKRKRTGEDLGTVASGKKAKVEADL